MGDLLFCFPCLHFFFSISHSGVVSLVFLGLFRRYWAPWVDKDLYGVVTFSTPRSNEPPDTVEMGFWGKREWTPDGGFSDIQAVCKERREEKGVV